MLFASTPARWLAALACLFTVTLAHASDDGNDRSVTIEKDLRRTVLAADSSYHASRELVVRINEERGLKSHAQQSLPYNRTQETLEITEAYTLKPDGRKIAVGPQQIREQQEAQSVQAPMFNDSLVKVVIFPEIAVGDRLVLHYQVQRNTALFPGQFEDLSFPAFNPTEQMSLTYDVPQGVKLNVEAKGFQAKAVQTKAGRSVYQWDYQPADKARRELGSVAYSDYGQYLAVSTFDDYASFARAYAQRAEVEVTPAIRALAESLTAKLDTPREKALVLSDWVRRNIRYVAVYIGSGSVVPHAADTVLSNRYGDCKDHVALLQALLQAVDIDSTPALVNLGTAFELPKVPTLGVINHAVNYLPQLDLYLDSTAEPVAAGYLPVVLLNKPTLLTSTGTLGRTPSTQAGKVENLSTFHIDANGGARFEHDSIVEGWGAELNRWGVRSMPQADRDVMIQRILANYGQTGEGKMLPAKEQDENSPHYEMKFTGTTNNLVNLPGPTGMPTLSSLAGGIAQNVFGFIAEKTRSQPFLCIGGVTEEQARFEFPAEVKILAVPNPVQLDTPYFAYNAEYLREGNTVLVKRRYDFRHASPVCSAKDFTAMQPALESMIRDLKSQVIVQRD